MTTPVQHGTRAGWNWHLRRGVPICGPCREANRLYIRGIRSRKGVGRATTWPREMRADLIDLPTLGAVIAESMRGAA